MPNILKHTICYVMLLVVSLIGCGSDEQMVVEEEAEENIQIAEEPTVESRTGTDTCSDRNPRGYGLRPRW